MANNPRNPNSWNEEMKDKNLGSLADIRSMHNPDNVISNMEQLWTDFNERGLRNIVIQPSSNNQNKVHFFKELHAKLSRDYIFNVNNKWCHIVRCTFAYLASNTSLIQPDDLFVGAEEGWNAIVIKHIRWKTANTIYGNKMLICHFDHGQTDLYEVAAFLYEFTRINIKEFIVPPAGTIDSELFRALMSLTPEQQNALGKTILSMNTQDTLTIPSTSMNGANGFNPHLCVIEPRKQGPCYGELEDFQDDNMWVYIRLDLNNRFASINHLQRFKYSHNDLEAPKVREYVTARHVQGIPADIRYLEMDWYTAKKSILECYQVPA